MAATALRMFRRHSTKRREEAAGPSRSPRSIAGLSTAMISAPTSAVLPGDARVRSAFSSSSDSTRSSGATTSDSAATALPSSAQAPPVISTSELLLRRAESAAHLGVPSTLDDDESVYSQPSRPATPTVPTLDDRSQSSTPRPLPLDSDPTTIVNAAGWSRPVNSSHSSLDVSIGDAGTAAIEPPGPGPALVNSAATEAETAEVMLELAIQELDDIDSSTSYPAVARNSAGYFQTSTKLRYTVRLLANDTKLLADPNQIRLAPIAPPLFAHQQQVIALKRGLCSHGIYIYGVELLSRERSPELVHVLESSLKALPAVIQSKSNRVLFCSSISCKRTASDQWTHGPRAGLA